MQWIDQWSSGGVGQVTRVHTAGLRYAWKNGSAALARLSLPPDHHVSRPLPFFFQISDPQALCKVCKPFVQHLSTFKTQKAMHWLNYYLWYNKGAQKWEMNMNFLAYVMYFGGVSCASQIHQPPSHITNEQSLTYFSESEDDLTHVIFKILSIRLSCL